MGKLGGKCAIITGGASGMGAAQAKIFVAEGARVVIADLDSDRGTELAASLGEAAKFVSLDVRSETAWENALSIAEDHFNGPVSILVNNAGILREAALENTTLEEFRFLIDVMQVGVFLGMKTVAPSIRKAGGGAIVNMSSSAGILAYPDLFAYTTVKWAVRGMTKAAALDLAPDHIRVNSIHPGNVDTPMIEGKGFTCDAIPLKRNATAEEVASLTLFLVSDEAQYITGSEHLIDGGLTAGCSGDVVP